MVRGKKVAVVTINGRDHYLGPHGSKVSIAEYDRLVGEYLASGRSSKYGLPDETTQERTIAELVAEYGRWAKSYYVRADSSQTGVHRNMAPLMKRLLKTYGRQPVSEFRPLQFRAMIESMVADDLAGSTIGDSISRIKHKFRWAVAREIVEAEQFAALQAVTRERSGRKTEQVEAVPPDHINLVLPLLTRVAADMVRVQCLTGMRPGEVCAIKESELYQTDNGWF